MNWIGVVGLAVYAAALGAAVAIAVLATRKLRFHSYTGWFLLAVGCLIGGLWFASLATPDWSPITMLALYVPFLFVGVYAALRARRSSSGRG